jgi:hypothetical protein
MITVYRVYLEESLRRIKTLFCVASFYWTKGITNNAVDRPVSPRLWKNVMTAALVKVELQVICRHSVNMLR